MSAVAAARQRAGAAPLALAAAVVAVSFSGIFIRVADSGYAVVVWTRMLLTIPFLLPLLAADIRRGAVPRGRREWGEVLLSGTCLCVHFLSWTASLALTSVASSVLLVCTHPVAVALAGRRILGEPVSRRLWAGIALAMAGVAVTAGGDLHLGAREIAGDLLALVGAVSITGYILIGRRAAGRWGTAAYSVPCYAIVAAGALLATPVTGAGAPTARTLGACLGLAVVCTVLGHTVMNWTLRHLRATTLSLALLGEPPATALLAVPLLGERPPLATVAGGVVVLLGLALAVTEAPAPTEPVAAALASAET